MTDATDITEGPPAGYIIASGEVMMYWLPAGVPDPLGIGTSPDDEARPVMTICERCDDDEFEGYCEDCDGTGYVLVDSTPADADDLDDRTSEERSTL